jgi:hypothetical protein
MAENNKVPPSVEDTIHMFEETGTDQLLFLDSIHGHSF